MDPCHPPGKAVLPKKPKIQIYLTGPIKDQFMLDDKFKIKVKESTPEQNRLIQQNCIELGVILVSQQNPELKIITPSTKCLTGHAAA